MRRSTLAKLSQLLPDGAAPSEIRIFKAGANTSTKGTFLFDAIAARSVMDAYEKHGIDLMFDLEHLSLDDEHPNFDPDARGWAKLELRNGELWAVGVKWTPDGLSRLNEKRQRYISPAFDFDPKTRRILRLANVAITSLPATDDLTPLVAASNRETRMDPKLLEALGLPADATMEQVLAAIAAMKSKQEEAMKKLADTMDKGDAGDKAPPSSKAPGAPAKTSARDGDLATSLAKDVARLTAQINQQTVLTLLTASRGKTTPAFEKWALTQTPEKVQEVLSVLPERPADKNLREPEKSSGQGTDVQLTAADRKVCKLTGTSEADFLAQKKKLAARDMGSSATGAEEEV